MPPCFVRDFFHFASLIFRDADEIGFGFYSPPISCFLVSIRSIGLIDLFSILPYQDGKDWTDPKTVNIEP